MTEITQAEQFEWDARNLLQKSIRGYQFTIPCEDGEGMAVIGNAQLESALFEYYKTVNDLVSQANELTKLRAQVAEQREWISCKLFNLPYGTVFKLKPDGLAQYVFLSHEDTGLIATHQPNINECSLSQTMLSAAETREEFESMMVFVPQPPANKDKQS